MRKISDPLKDIMRRAAKYVDKVEEAGRKDNIYYFKVGDNEVRFELTPARQQVSNEPLGPYKKEMSCSCKHYALFGARDNIPCSHIYAVIAWLIKEKVKPDGRGKKEVGG